MAAFASKLMEKVVRAACRGGLKDVALGGRCPPDPLGFIALGLLQQGG